MATRDGPPRWVPLSGLAAVPGAALWLLAPWLQVMSLGTRPYVGTGYDVLSLVGWVLMAAGLCGLHRLFRDRYGLRGTVAGAITGAGMALVALLLLRSVSAFVTAGFRPVPATGEDPAGLVLTWLALLGFGLTLVGAVGVGLALWSLEPRPTLTAALLVLAGVVLRVTSLLPVPLGRLLVETNAPLVPLGLAWLSLGRLVLVEGGQARRASSRC